MMVPASERHHAAAHHEPPPAPNVGIFQVVWRRKSLIILGGVIGLVVGALYYARATPVYQSIGQLMVIRKSSSSLLGGGDPRSYYYDDYLATHQILIRSPLIVQKAVKKNQLNSLRMFQGNDPTGEIISSLTILRDNNNQAYSSNNILNLAYRGQVPDECGKVLESVIDSYKDFLDKTYESVSSETLNQMTEVAKKLQAELREKQSDYDEFKKSSKLIYWKGGEGSNPREMLLSQIHDKRLSLEPRKALLEAQLKDIEIARREGKDRSKILAMIAAANAKSAQSRAAYESDRTLIALELELATLTGLYGSEHPQIVALQKKISRLKEMESRADVAANDRTKAKTGQFDPNDPVQVHILSLKQELEEIIVQLRTFNDLYQKEEKEAQEISQYKEQDRRKLADIDQTRRLFVPISEDLQKIKLVLNVGGYDVKVLAAPGPGGKVGPNPMQVFLIAGLLGSLGGLGLAYLAEVTDKSFRTPDDIRRRLGLTVIGHIPLFRPDTAPESGAATGIDSTLITFHNPKSVQAEAYRGLRTALYFNTKGETHKIIQVTSPNARDGKSTMTANLAICIAQSGKRVLLIDADMRKPRVHKIFGLPSTIGLSAVITGEVQAKDAIVETPMPNLWVMPCGQRPANPAELVTSPRFKDLLESLRNEYDFVLVDTPPLLAVSDPSVVAARVDGVILVIRVVKNGQPNAERAREILTTLAANVVGVVVNGVGRGPGGSTYDYNRDYNYYYDYGYAYGYGSYYYHKENGTYYREDSPDSEGTSENGTAGKETAEIPRQPTRQLPARTQSPPADGPEHQPPGPAPERKGLLRSLFSWWD
jgi:polysaccharide biosynthesis transport protein